MFERISMVQKRRFSKKCTNIVVQLSQYNSSCTNKSYRLLRNDLLILLFGRFSNLLHITAIHTNYLCGMEGMYVIESKCYGTKVFG